MTGHCTIPLSIALLIVQPSILLAQNTAGTAIVPETTAAVETTAEEQQLIEEPDLVPVTDPGDLDTSDQTGSTTKEPSAAETSPTTAKQPTDTATGAESPAAQEASAAEQETGTTIPEAERTALGITGADHELTVKYRERYLTDTGRQWLAGVLADSVPYRPYIRQQLQKENLPMILQYLPIVESNYKTSAVSRAGAVGIWQFMTNSMAPYLKKNAWYDDRRDPWKATDAALNKLSENYKMFGDWSIAIAAYNCGAGAMARLIKKYPGKDFWYLAEHNLLRTQSAQYVPKLLAIADIIENAEYYGAIEVGAADKMIEDVSVEEFDFVNVAGMLSLAQVSKVTGIPQETVSLLNPALFRGCTPARQTYKLRFPKGTGEAAESALKEHGVATDAVTYTVVQGDSLWSISRKYGVTVNDLCEVNNLKENGILSIGQTLIVPIFKEEKQK